MAYTGQRALDRAYEILQDNGTRYLRPQLIGFLNEGIAAVRRVRPDLFIGQYTAPLPQVTEGTINNALPTPDSIFEGLAHYIAGRAELRDDEFAVDGRAMTMKSQLTQTLLQGV